MRVMAYDVETSGLPNFGAPSTDLDQPTIVELAAVLFDDQTGRVHRAMSTIFQALRGTELVEIPADVVAIHGISTELACEVGEPPERALATFWSMWALAEARVAHNETFDARMLRIALFQAGFDGPAETWKADERPALCTMRRMKQWWKAEHAAEKNEAGFSLDSCLELAGIEPIGKGHGALVDAWSVRGLHLWLGERGI